MNPAVATYHYRHFVPLCVLPYLMGFACLIMAGVFLFQNGPMPAILLLCFNGLLFSVIGAGFHYMTVVDKGAHLAVSFGPLTFLKKEVQYDDIRAVELGKMNVLDGLGIGLSLRGGWFCNPGARNCVVVHLKKGFIPTVRIGTNDVENLIRFLESRILLPT